MRQSTINHYNSYNQRIQFLRTEGNELMQQIQMLEISMNRRKQQNQQPHKDEITMLQWLVKKLLYFLAEINTCQYFQNYQFNGNSYNYKQMCTRYYQDLMLRFILKLQSRNIDFTIN